MIDAKEAERLIGDLIAENAEELDLAVFETSYALRGIMGELYKMRKLKELETTQMQAQYGVQGNPDFTEFYDDE